MPGPQPLEDGLYWLRDNSKGAWLPMVVILGEPFHVSTYFQEGEDGVHSLARVTDATPTVHGPLAMPQGRA